MAATIYFCITGQVPEESIQRVEKDTLKKPSELGVSMPKKQEAVLLKGLAVKGQDRYRSMEEFRRELLSTGGVIGTVPKPGFGNKKVVIGVAAAVVVVGAVAGIGTHEELLAGCPVYQEIYYSQFPKEEVANG